MKKAILVVSVGVLSMVSGCGTQPRQSATSAAPSTVQAASPKPVPTPDQNAEAAAPATGRSTTPNPDLNYVKVDVVASGVVRSDWSQSTIRVIEAKNSEGDVAYFTCETVLRGKANEVLMYNGKPLPNHACFQPRLHVVYTLMSLGDGSEWYWMNPPGDDGDDEMDGKHPLVLYCPQCKPDSQ